MSTGSRLVSPLTARILSTWSKTASVSLTLLWSPLSLTTYCRPPPRQGTAHTLSLVTWKHFSICLKIFPRGPRSYLYLISTNLEGCLYCQDLIQKAPHTTPPLAHDCNKLNNILQVTHASETTTLNCKILQSLFTS